MYKRLPGNTPEILRRHGLKVREVPGWETRGRPVSTGDFEPVGVLCHHTATGPKVADSDVVNLLVKGRADLPGPLAQFGLARDGTVYLIASGRANHAGVAKAAGSVAKGDGNKLYAGVEAFNDGVGEKWSAVQYEAYVLLCSVVQVEFTKNSHKAVNGHKETSVTGKIDPTFDMGNFRTKVEAKMREISRPAPKPQPLPTPKPSASGTDVVVATNNIMSLPKNTNVVKTILASTTTPSLVGLQELDPADFKKAAEALPGWDLVDIPPSDKNFAEGIIYEESVWELLGKKYVKAYDGVGGISYTRHLCVARVRHKVLDFEAIVISYHAVTSGMDRKRVAMRLQGLKALRKEISRYKKEGVPIFVFGDYNSKVTQHPSATVKLKHDIDHIYFWNGKKVTGSKKAVRIVDTKSDHDVLIARFALNIKK